ncbi:GTP-binding protein [Streptomyces sp. NPDC048845]|uniref:GTP-binding protein n=1 Tax=Streptomyces sp. NPDC048845 TaxID=3155390 RepID=UPI00342D1208
MAGRAPAADRPSDIRNVVLVGHSGSGKTTLVEALALTAGAIGRAGRVEDGGTVSDHDEIEHRQQRSVQLSLVPVEWGGITINVLDTPGYADFVGEVRAGLRAADAALFVVSAADGVDGATRLLWDECAAVGMPRAIVVTHLESARAGFEEMTDICRKAFGGDDPDAVLPRAAHRAARRTRRFHRPFTSPHRQLLMEPRNYRMVVSTAQDFVTTSAEADRQLHHWVGVMKRYDTSALDKGRNEIAEGVTLDHDAAAGRHGSYSRWRLRENRPGNQGTWQSTLVVRSDNGKDSRRTWLQVDIEHHPADARLRPTRANTPGIAKLLLDSLPAQDGIADVASEPKFVEPDDVEEVIEELCDQERRLPIVIASVPYGKKADAWTDEVVVQAFRNLPGLEVMYVLTPEAQTLFNTTLDYHPVSAAASAPTSRVWTPPGSPTPSATW